MTGSKDLRSSLQMPVFRYHPDPLSTNSIVVSDAECLACGESRGFIYDGPSYTAEDLEHSFCPWCIADGSANEKFGVEFTDVSSDVPGGVPTSVTQEIATRTPGFIGWQMAHWLYHCQDGAAFLGIIGESELIMFPGAVQAIRQEGQQSGWDDNNMIEDYIKSLSVDSPPSAYLFRCLNCAEYLAYSDFA